MNTWNDKRVVGVNTNFIKQWTSEKESWKELLSFCQDKSFSLKIKLIKFLKKIDGTDHVMMEKVENFQNRVLQAEQIMQILRLEIAEQEKLLQSALNNLNNEAFIRKVEQQQNKLKREVQICENNCYVIAADFNNMFEI